MTQERTGRRDPRPDTTLSDYRERGVEPHMYVPPPPPPPPVKDGGIGNAKKD